MINILVVDDSENDRLLIQQALKKSAQKFYVSEAEDVRTALAFLEGEEKFADRTLYPMPKLILCDIHLPRQDGFTLMDCLRSRPEFKYLSIAAMSGLFSTETRELAFKKGACACIDKGDLVNDPTLFFRAVEDCLRDVGVL